MPNEKAGEITVYSYTVIVSPEFDNLLDALSARWGVTKQQTLQQLWDRYEQFTRDLKAERLRQQDREREYRE